MAKLIYSAIASLDGYVEDEEGKFDWAEPDEEVHAFVNDLERPVGTYLYGRRMYETMAFWETAPELAAQPPFVRDFAEIWQSGRQDRLLQDAADGVQCQDPDRARVRPGGGPAAEGESRRVTSVWAVPRSRPRRSRLGSSTSTSCSSCPSWWEAASVPCPATMSG